MRKTTSGLFTELVTLFGELDLCVEAAYTATLRAQFDVDPIN